MTRARTYRICSNRGSISSNETSHCNFGIWTSNSDPQKRGLLTQKCYYVWPRRRCRDRRTWYRYCSSRTAYWMLKRTHFLKAGSKYKTSFLTCYGHWGSKWWLITTSRSRSYWHLTRGAQRTCRTNWIIVISIWKMLIVVCVTRLLILYSQHTISKCPKKSPSSDYVTRVFAYTVCIYFIIINFNCCRVQSIALYPVVISIINTV